MFKLPSLWQYLFTCVLSHSFLAAKHIFYTKNKLKINYGTKGSKST